MFKGVITALVTPFKNGEIDIEALEKLVEWQIGEGINGLGVCAATGESSTLSMEERKLVMTTVKKIVKKRVPIITGIGTNNTVTTIDQIKQAETLEVDGVLMVTPYYSKPPQEAMYQHFKNVAGETKLPVILYNVPGRTGVNLADETILRLSEVENIVGIKDATGDIMRPLRLKAQNIRSDFTLLTGEDAIAVAFNACGGEGVISVLSNLVPKKCVEIWNKCKSNDFIAARELQKNYIKLVDLLFLETNPIPVKCALALMGKIKNELRMPLIPASKNCEEQLALELNKLGII